MKKRYILAGFILGVQVGSLLKDEAFRAKIKTQVEGLPVCFCDEEGCHKRHLHRLMFCDCDKDGCCRGEKCFD